MTSGPPAAPSDRPRRSTVPHGPTRRQRVLSWLVHAGVVSLAALQRVHLQDPHGVRALVRTRPTIFAIWHNRLALTMPVRDRIFEGTTPRPPLAALVSASRDGAFLAAVLESFGAHAVRGSSSRRGSRALLELHDLASRGHHLAITPDGPRGPRYSMHPGAAAIARLAQMPIVPVGVNYSWKIQLPTWDRFQIPLPGSRCDILLGEPLWVPEMTEDLEPLIEVLRQRLMALTRD